MIESLIAGFFGYFSVVMLVAAFVLAAVGAWLKRGKPCGNFAEQLLRWVLLLSVGVQGVYTFVVHVFFPVYSAEHIGWEVSPFQFEVGIADLTVGVLGIIAFWSNFSFRVAAAIAAIVWYGGDAIWSRATNDHCQQLIPPGNAGSWFWTDVLVPIALVVSVLLVWRERKVDAE